MEMIECCVPPGFRFHPTEEELVGYYLNRKVNSLKIDLDVIADVDLYRIEPWDIQERCKLGYDEQNEWYFFSHKDRKYPTGTRTNRATAAGFWKATGRDKAVVSTKEKAMIGMRKTLVFYRGRAPNGKKTHWIMHEYRLQSSELAPPQEEGWVVCRAFKKPIPNNNNNYHHNNHIISSSYYLRDINNNNNNNNNNCYHSPTTTLDSSNNTTTIMTPIINNTYNQLSTNFPQFPFTSTQDHHHHHNDRLIDLPHLDSPTITASEDQEDFIDKNSYNNNNNNNNNNKLVVAPQDEMMTMMMMNDHQVLPSSYSFANMPLLIRDDDDPRNHMSHLLECFPDI